MLEVEENGTITLTKKDIDWINKTLSPHMVSIKECRDVMRFLSSKYKMENEDREEENGHVAQ